jgi:hypothetical protein
VFYENDGAGASKAELSSRARRARSSKIGTLANLTQRVA